MIQVHTRGGVFGPGGYGGGIFDGSESGFGGYEQASAGIGGLGVFPAPSKYPNGYPSPTYTTKSGETGSSIALDITGSASNWTALANANPSKKCTTYGMCFGGGTVLTLPPTWVAGSASPPSSSGATIAKDDVAFLVDVVNSMLYDMGYAPISGAITQVNASLCGAADFVAKQIQAGNKLLNAQDVSDFIGLAKQYGATMSALCQPVAPWPVPAKSTTVPTPSPAPSPPAATNPFVAIWKSAGLDLASEAARLGHDPCLVRAADAGSAVVAEMQQSMNVLLQKNGFKPIPVNGNWDGATCGALFALSGKWDPLISLCQIAGRDDVGGWQVPAGCKTGTQPVAPTPVDSETPTTTTKASMAWMVGGLLAAAAIAGVVATKKR